MRLLLLLISLTATLAGRAEKVVFYPGWFTSMQFAGFYVALDKGFYTDAGIDVEVKPFAYGLNVPKLMAESDEQCLIGTIEGYILMQRRAQGFDLQALAPFLQQSPAGFMILADTPIHSINDFPGHKIGVHKFADPLYNWFMTSSGHNPTDADMIFVGDNPETLVKGEVDVMQGYATEEFVRLQAMTGGSSRFISFASLGFPSYSEILFTSGPILQKHPATVRHFIEVTRAGWEYALAHPEEAVASIAAHTDGEVDRAHLLAVIKALAPYVQPEGVKALVPMDAGRWETVQKACLEMGFLKTPEPVANFLPAVE